MSGTATNKDCPLCLNQGKQAKLRLFQATSEEALLFCEDDECPYPFDEEDHEFCIKRDWSEAVENWKILRKAEDLEFQKRFGHIELNKSSQQMCLYKDIPLGEMANDSEKLLDVVSNLKQLQQADASLLAIKYKDKNETLTLESSDEDDDDDDDNEKQNSVTLFKPLRDNKRLEMLMANVPSEETFLKELENFEEILEDNYVMINNEPGDSELVGMNGSENSSTVELPSINTGNTNCEEPARTGMSQEITQPSVPINKLDHRFEEMQTHCIDQNSTSSNQDTDQLNNQDLSKIGVINIPIVQDKEIDQHKDGIAQMDVGTDTCLVSYQVMQDVTCISGYLRRKQNMLSPKKELVKTMKFAVPISKSISYLFPMTVSDPCDSAMNSSVEISTSKQCSPQKSRAKPQTGNNVSSHKTDKRATMSYPLVESCMPEELLHAWQSNSNTSRSTGTALPVREVTIRSRLSDIMVFMKNEVEGEERISLALAGFGVGTDHRSTRKKRGQCQIEDSVPTTVGLITLKVLLKERKIVLFVTKITQICIDLGASPNNGSGVRTSPTPPSRGVDSNRIKEVGPDRACAEWLMKNGAFVKWENESDFLKNYDCLPSEDDRRHIVEVDATEASITYLGFAHFKTMGVMDFVVVESPYLPTVTHVTETSFCPTATKVAGTHSPTSFLPLATKDTCLNTSSWHQPITPEAAN
uniref:Uncharacterized protein n=1 Tax=Timema monikensis TaxID=170555 RepID=A0A7R9DZR3_9NEOP|nr:unnamed protein product [Timema monikensis]